MNDYPLFLLLYGNYKNLECALIHQTILARSVESHKNASKNILLIINNLLDSCNKKLSDCAFIAAHQGPAPFTTLRTVIATVNGLGFATHIHLMGINGLETFVKEHANPSFDYTIALLNAFGNDIYYAIHNQKTDEIRFGCQSFTEFMMSVELLHKENPNARLQCIGNAVPLYKDQLSSFSTITLHENVSFVSLEALVRQAQLQWKLQQALTTRIMPLYLKKTL